MRQEPSIKMTVQSRADRLILRASGQTKSAQRLVFPVPSFRFLSPFSHAEIHRSLSWCLRFRQTGSPRGEGLPPVSQRLEGGRRCPRPQVICGRVHAQAALRPRQEVGRLPDRRLENVPRSARQGACNQLPASRRSRSRTRAPCQVRRSDAVRLKRSFSSWLQRTVWPSGSRALTAPAMGLLPGNRSSGLPPRLGFPNQRPIIDREWRSFSKVERLFSARRLQSASFTFSYRPAGRRILASREWLEFPSCPVLIPIGM